MEKTVGISSHVNRVNKISLRVMFGMVALAVLGIVRGVVELNVNFGVLVLGVIVAAVLYKLKKLEPQIGIILCYTYFLFIMLGIISNKNLDYFLVSIIINVSFITLYLNKSYCLHMQLFLIFLL